MMLRLVLSDEAFNDVSEAYRWYESQRPGLGREFLNAVDVVLDRIQGYPHAHPVVHKSARRALLRRFPYAIYYMVENDAVVFACCHTRRHWATWQNRMKAP